MQARLKASMHCCGSDRLPALSLLPKHSISITAHAIWQHGVEMMCAAHKCKHAWKQRCNADRVTACRLSNALAAAVKAPSTSLLPNHFISIAAQAIWQQGFKTMRTAHKCKPGWKQRCNADRASDCGLTNSLAAAVKAPSTCLPKLSISVTAQAIWQQGLGMMCNPMQSI